MSDSFTEKSLTERGFLHDISNQLVIAQGMGSFVLSSISKKENEDSKELQRMQKVMKSVDKMIDMVRGRREVVKNLEAAE